MILSGMVKAAVVAVAVGLLLQQSSLLHQETLHPYHGLNIDQTVLMGK